MNLSYLHKAPQVNAHQTKFSGISIGTQPEILGSGQKIYSLQVVAPDKLPDSSVREGTSSLQAEDIIGYGQLRNGIGNGSNMTNLIPNTMQAAKDFTRGLTAFFFDSDGHKKPLNIPTEVLFAFAKGAMLKAMACLKEPIDKMTSTNVQSIVACDTITLKNDNPDIVEFLFQVTSQKTKRAYQK